MVLHNEYKSRYFYNPEKSKSNSISKILKTTNPNYKKRVEKFLERQHFMKLLGFHLEVIQPGRTSGKLKLTEKHQQQTGLVHGGVTATLADIVTGFAAYTLVPENYHVVTAELKISYLNPGRGTQLEAVGWVLKAGKKLHFCEAEVWDIDYGDKVLIAKASAVMAIIPPH